METIKLIALRDFAIEHLPRAKQAQKQKYTNQDDFHHALYGACALAQSSTTITAVEMAAANLLRHTMTLAIDWNKDSKPSAKQRHELEHQAIAAATDLCSLTGTSLSWLGDAMKHETPPAPAEPVEQEEAPAAPQTTGLAPLVAGLDLTTNEAAAYLKHHPQTLRNWASNGDGKIQPKRSGNRLYWKSEDVLRITCSGRDLI